MPRDPRPAASGAELHPSSARRLFRKAVREPLLHFLLIGAALFALYSMVAPQRVQDPGSQIELTKDDLRQIELAWAAKWKRPPTPAEWHDLVENQIREEVLYREALKMGLDQGDEIIRRRLGQKLDFLIEDMSAIRDPTETELKAWFPRHAAQFALPGRVTFCHAYFSPDVGPMPEGRARQALATLKSDPSCSATASIGDRFPDYDFYADRSAEEIASVFGTDFSRAVFQLKPGVWQGPVSSGLGSHLVLVEKLMPSRIPAFDEVDRAQMVAAWLDDQRAQSKRKMYDAVRAKYEVVVPERPRP